MEIGFLAYPRLTALELVAPWEVLTRLPESRAHLVWTRPGPILAERGIELTATTAFEDCPPLDVLVIPGGPGQASLMRHALLIDFLRASSGSARFVCAVGSGLLLLAQAVPLTSKRVAATGDVAEQVRAAGARITADAFTLDGNLATAAASAAALEMALAVAARLGGPEVAGAVRREVA